MASCLCFAAAFPSLSEQSCALGSAGQVPASGSMVLAFQQRKSYDLYYDADVVEVKADAAGEPQVLVQYLHGPEERMTEYVSALS